MKKLTWKLFSGSFVILVGKTPSVKVTVNCSGAHSIPGKLLQWLQEMDEDVLLFYVAAADAGRCEAL